MGGLYFCSAKFARMIVGEYEQTAVYKRYNVVGNVADIVLETSCVTFNPENVFLLSKT